MRKLGEGSSDDRGCDVPEFFQKHTASLYLTTMQTFDSLYFTTMRTFVPSAYFSS